MTKFAVVALTHGIRREGRAALGARPVEQQQAGAGTGEPRGLGAAERAERTGDEDGLS